MSLRDEARALRKSTPTCALGAVMQQDKKLAAEIVEALEDVTVPGTAIAAALKNRGVEVSASSVQRHRSKGCACESP